MKKCILCNEVKDLESFYSHKEMKDGKLSKCKECCKKQAKKRHHEKNKDLNWVESERLRAREKYKRLNYKERQKELNKDKPWKQNSIYKGLRRKVKSPKGTELHHWCYKDDFLEDVLIMNIKEHRNLHSKLTLIKESLIFVTDCGLILDTKEKHLKFIKSLKLNYIEL